jgi:hypothetical protein
MIHFLIEIHLAVLITLVSKPIQIQADYVLPIGESSQFEAGYKGNFNDITKDFSFPGTNIGTIDPNTLEYKEKINAIYTQYGFKVNKISYLFGLRWEDTNIDINLLDTILIIKVQQLFSQVLS